MVQPGGVGEAGGDEGTERVRPASDVLRGAVGEPVGTAWGRHRYSVPSLAGVPATRSLEGSAAVFLVGGLAASLGLAFTGVAPAQAVGVGFCCGAVGAAVEAVSHHGTDNLTIQLSSAGTAYFLLSI